MNLDNLPVWEWYVLDFKAPSGWAGTMFSKSTVAVETLVVVRTQPQRGGGDFKKVIIPRKRTIFGVGPSLGKGPQRRSRAPGRAGGVWCSRNRGGFFFFRAVPARVSARCERRVTPNRAVSTSTGNQFPLTSDAKNDSGSVSWDQSRANYDREGIFPPGQHQIRCAGLGFPSKLG